MILGLCPGSHRGDHVPGFLDGDGGIIPCLSLSMEGLGVNILLEEGRKKQRWGSHWAEIAPCSVP